MLGQSEYTARPLTLFQKQNSNKRNASSIQKNLGYFYIYKCKWRLPIISLLCVGSEMSPKVHMLKAWPVALRVGPLRGDCIPRALVHDLIRPLMNMYWVFWRRRTAGKWREWITGGGLFKGTDNPVLFPPFLPHPSHFWTPASSTHS